MSQRRRWERWRGSVQCGAAPSVSCRNVGACRSGTRRGTEGDTPFKICTATKAKTEVTAEIMFYTSYNSRKASRTKELEALICHLWFVMQLLAGVLIRPWCGDFIHTIGKQSVFNNQYVNWHHLTGTCESKKLWLHSVFVCVGESVCLLTLHFTYACWGMLPSNLCSSLGLSRGVCLQDHLTCALNNTHESTWHLYVNLL